MYDEEHYFLEWFKYMNRHGKIWPKPNSGQRLICLPETLLGL